MSNQPMPCLDCGEPLTVEGDNDPAMTADPVHVFCDICGDAEHAADLTPDWNGETGNHRSCEQAIVYQDRRRGRMATLDHRRLNRPVLHLE